MGCDHEKIAIPSLQAKLRICNGNMCLYPKQWYVVMVKVVFFDFDCEDKLFAR
jgi:hypothetical protein